MASLARRVLPEENGDQVARTCHGTPISPSCRPARSRPKPSASAPLTITIDRIDGGKPRCTGASSDDAVVIHPGEILAFQKIERQAHALRAPAPGREPPADTPDLVRMISRP
jgi:hypothetical protein